MAEISTTMQAGLDYIRQGGGAIERRDGGFWMHPKAPPFKSGMEYVKTQTVHAMSRRGLVELNYIGKQPRATLTQAGINATNWTPTAGESARGVAEAPACWCETCRPITMNDMRMVLCPTCGNKRCPHATDHRNACTKSNEPGQPGSSYGVSVGGGGQGKEGSDGPTR